MAKDFNRQHWLSFLYSLNTLRAVGLIFTFLVLLSPSSAQTKSGSYLAIVKWTHLVPDGGTTTCIVVGLDGQFHSESTVEAKGAKKVAKTDEVRISTGYLPDEYFEQLKKLLEVRELEEVGSPPPPPEINITHEMDAVVLSVHRPNTSQYVGFVDYDGRHPIPKYAADFVPWMKAVRSLDDVLIKDPQKNMCLSLEPTGDFLPQMIRR